MRWIICLSRIKGIKWNQVPTLVLLLSFTHILLCQADELRHSVTLERNNNNLNDLHEWDHNYLFGNVPKDEVKWQSAQVRVMSSGRRVTRAALRSWDNHVIEVQSPVDKTSMVIHLVKRSSIIAPDLRVVESDGDTLKVLPMEESSSSSSCVYQGSVRTSDGRQGRAALSSCNDHLRGFSGVILTDKGEWFLEPHPNPNMGNEEKGNFGQIPHLILSAPDSSFYLNNSISSDGLRVPRAELEAAATLAALDAERRLRRRTTESEDQEEAESIPSFLSPYLPDGFFPNAAAWLSPETKGSKKVSRTTNTNTDTEASAELLRSGDSEETSSEEVSNQVVEIAVFTDQELYAQMKKKYPNDTTTKLKDYVTTMINMMDLLYEHESLGVSLSFRLVHLEILKKSPTKLNNQGGKAKAYLSSFCDFAGDKNVDSGLWDHALLLTGIDLHEEGLKSTAGLAWAGTMCYRYYSCSISEGTAFGSAYIITHEIGHSLGMEHDGVGVSDTCDKDKFIMSPTTGPGKTNWSSCSSDNLKDFIRYGTSELRGRKSANTPVCLSQLSSARNGRKSTLEFSQTTPFPGEKYDAAQQCLLSMGAPFKPYFDRHRIPFNNICWMLYCGNGTHAISTHPALEGTQCDRQKYCRGGHCVKKPKLKS